MKSFLKKLKLYLKVSNKYFTLAMAIFFFIFAIFQFFMLEDKRNATFTILYAFFFLSMFYSEILSNTSVIKAENNVYDSYIKNLVNMIMTQAQTLNLVVESNEKVFNELNQKIKDLEKEVNELKEKSNHIV